MLWQGKCTGTIFWKVLANSFFPIFNYEIKVKLNFPKVSMNFHSRTFPLPIYPCLAGVAFLAGDFFAGVAFFLVFGFVFLEALEVPFFLTSYPMISLFFAGLAGILYV